jgi:hypothetical protein
MLIETGLSYDNGFPRNLRIPVIASGIKLRSFALRPNAIEERDILLRVKKARHPLVSRTVLPGDGRRGTDIARIADLGRIRVTLEQERLRPGAGGAQCPKEQCKKELPPGAAVKDPQSEAASMND